MESTLRDINMRLEERKYEESKSVSQRGGDNKSSAQTSNRGSPPREGGNLPVDEVTLPRGLNSKSSGVTLREAVGTEASEKAYRQKMSRDSSKRSMNKDAAAEEEIKSSRT